MLLNDPATILAILAAGLVLDWLIGDPEALYRRVPHPAVLIGAAVGGLDRWFNRGRRKRLRGIVALVLLVAGSLAAGRVIDAVLGLLPPLPAALTEALIVAVFLAQKSLWQHVCAVARELASGGLAAGRRAVSRIVGRDPQSLDGPGVCRAAIESCAENFADGVVAPAFWYAVLGLPGLLAYKAINTADSMIGHKTARHGEFGWAAARFDDFVNLLPARLGGLLIAAAALLLPRGGPGAALRAMRRDASRHTSPNAGWPEAAMAGALGIRLAGPRRYGTAVVDGAWMGDGTADLTPADIRRALRLYVAACLVLLAAVLGGLAVL